MRDGPLRVAVKRVALWHFRANLGLHRWIQRARGERPYLLGGQCGQCAACCEAPSIVAPKVFFYWSGLRWPYLLWQRVVNGFHLVEARPRQRMFVFRCTHYERETRSCDSYSSRPGMCRDYPRILLSQPRPEFLAGCGYRAVARNAEALRQAIDWEGVPPGKRDELRSKLFLDK